jgi:hypothetical protein
MKKSSFARAMSAKVRVTRRRRTVWDQKIHENGGLMGFNQQKLRFNGTVGCEKARIGIQPDLNQQKLGF